MPAWAPRLLLRSAVFEGNVSFLDATVTGVLKCHAHFEQQVDFTGATFRLEKVTDSKAVLLDLSGAEFGSPNADLSATSGGRVG